MLEASFDHSGKKVIVRGLHFGGRPPAKGVKERLFRLLLAVMGFLLIGSANPAVAAASPAAAVANPNIAFYYGEHPPVDELQAFDDVVIDPAVAALPDTQATPHTAWLARLDLRAQADSPGQTAEAYVSEAVTPLWNKGYRGFLLDDGAPLDQNDRPDDAWLAGLVQAIHAQYPQARVMLRNHLGLATRIADQLNAVMVDALYRRYDLLGGFFANVPDAERTDALRRIQALRRGASSLAVVAVDYCGRDDRACRRATARRLEHDGLTPFVTDPGFATVGIGRIEVMPRKILVVQTPEQGEPLDLTAGVRDIAMPLNYLGYDIQYADANQALPRDIDSDRYAGIVVAIDRTVDNPDAWRRWLLGRIRAGVRVAVVGQFGFPIDQEAARVLGLEVVPGAAPPDVAPQIVDKAPMMGFEILPPPDIRDALGVRVGAQGKPLLRLHAGSYVYDMAGMLPWGGYTLDPYGIATLGGIQQERWAIQPIEFFEQALALPEMPVPDVTTENGRRLLFVHVDGDGFASRAEFPGPAYGGQALYDQIFTKFPIPMTLSVIEGEVGPTGLYPKISPTLESIARQIFALPNVEIGSHTYSHPFNLEMIDPKTGGRITGKVRKEWGGDSAFSLDIPHYKFNLNREIQGSIDYINRRLAPPGKHVVVLQWPGDAAPPAIAVRRAYAAGVLNINGGDTVITKTNNSWTNIAPYGVSKGPQPDDFQVYAADMDENVYTGDWTGPFYGFTRALETYALTDRPIRFKAIDIYYHFYSGTKLASLRALRQIYESTLKQAVLPIYTTEYIKRVLDWRGVAVAREGNRWLVRSGPNLRELRWPLGRGVPDLTTATGVSGYLPGPGGLYIHMGGDQASFSITPHATARIPYIAEAAGFVRHYQRDARTMSFDFGGYYKPFVSFADANGCRVTVDGKAIAAPVRNGVLRVDVAGRVAQQVTYHSLKVTCE